MKLGYRGPESEAEFVEEVEACPAALAEEQSQGPRVLLVGELNPYGVDPRFALYFLPRRASGNRLRIILGLSDVDYCRLSKVNLCSGRWSRDAARREAARLVDEREESVFFLLGARVREAFNGPSFFRVSRVTSVRGQSKHLFVLPHPSGLNHMWNDLSNVEAARNSARLLAPGIAWGTVEK